MLARSVHILTLFFVLIRCQLSSSRLASAQQQTFPSSSAANEKASLALAASMLPFAAALPAFADETAAPATDAAAAVNTAQPIVFGFTALDLGFSFTPVLVYALFTLYRDKVNPRAKVRKNDFNLVRLKGC